MRTWVILLSALASLFSTTAVFAAESKRIVIATSASTGVVRRLREEMVALGFEVVLIDVPDGRKALEQAAKKEGAMAAVRIAPSSRALESVEGGRRNGPGTERGSGDDGVEVWVVDRVTGKTVLREVVSSGAQSDAEMALRAVELLRASLMEVEIEHPPRGEVTLPPPIIDAVLPKASLKLPDAHRQNERARPVAVIGAGPSFLASPGGMGSALHALVDARWMPFPSIGAEVLAHLPITSSRIQRDEGNAEIRITLVGVGVQLLPSPFARVSPSIGAGVFLAYFKMGGSARPPNTSANDEITTAAPYARFGLSVGWVPRVRVRFDLMTGWALAKPIVRMALQESAYWGRPFGAASSSIELEWP
ncbi:MAG: hypothetical protein NVS3B20_05460 [Polyangiales bacterium]